MLIAVIHTQKELDDRSLWQDADCLELRLDRLKLPLDELIRWRKETKKILLIAHPSCPLTLKKHLVLSPEWVDIPLGWDVSQFDLNSNTQIIHSAHIDCFDSMDTTLQTLHLSKASHYKCIVKTESTLEGLWLLIRQKEHRHHTFFAQGIRTQFTRLLSSQWGGFEYCYVHSPIAMGQQHIKDAIQRKNNVFRYAVIGESIQESKSPKYHQSRFDKHQHPGTYVKLDIPRSDFSACVKSIKQLLFHGLSITFPYKERLEEFNPMFQGIPFNTLVYTRGSYIAYNTDGKGCLKALTPTFQSIGIIGLGGTGKALATEAKQQGFEIVLCNRSLNKAIDLAKKLQCDYIPWDNAFELQKCDVVISCLPKGIAPLLGPQDYLDINYSHRSKEHDFAIKFFKEQARLQSDLWLKNHAIESSPIFDRSD